jgi:hypothetical protein
VALHSIESIQRLECSRLVEHDPALPPPGKGNAEVVINEFPRGHTEDVVELFESSLLSDVFVSTFSTPSKDDDLRFRQPEEDHAKGDHVKTGVEADGSSRSHGGQHEWESDGEYGCPEEAGSDCPTLLMD